MFCEDVLRVVLKFCVKNNTFPCAGQLTAVYPRIKGVCRPRTFFVNLYAHLHEASLEEAMRRDWDDYPSEFLCDLMVALAARRGKEVVPWEMDALEAVLFP